VRRPVTRIESICTMPSPGSAAAASAAGQKEPRSPRRSNRKARSSAWPTRCAEGAFIVASQLAADLRLGERRHAGMTGDRRLEDRDGERRAGGLAQPHAEIEQRPLAERLEQAAMARLGRAMGDLAVVERAAVEAV